MRSWQPGALGVVCVVAGASALARPGSKGAAAIPAPAASRTLAPSPTATATASAPAAELAFLPPANGVLGAWLVAGPFDRPWSDESHLSPRFDEPVGEGSGAPRWRLATTSGGVLDVAAALGAGDAKAQRMVGYAGGVVRVEHGGRHVLLLGVDDGVAVIIDGRRVFARDQVRARRDDEDMAVFELTPGEHSVLLSLERHGRPWGLRARLLGDALESPSGGWVLPGARADDARALAAKVARVTVDRGMGPATYRPVVHVRFPEGLPRGVSLPVAARLVRTSAGGGGEPLIDATIGEVGGTPPGDEESPLPLREIGAAEVENEDWSLEVELGGRRVESPLHPRRAVREACAHATQAIEATAGQPPWLAPASLASVEFLRDRLAGLVAHGDPDVEAQAREARELDELASRLDAGRDPYQAAPGPDGDAGGWRTGPMRRAYRSPVDGRLSEFAVYVPPGYSPKHTYPLIVALHGMNGRPLEMIMWLFGHDDPDHDGTWEDRHPRRDLEPLDAVVVAPDGHFNTMYRDMGEDDVMRVVDWATATYSIDPARISVTGPSMGGIGAAACALHHPDRFAAAEPLCGYQSFFLRSDIAGRPLRPWERLITEERSNVFWAENGMYLPMYIVHGTKDLPEENSGVLIDRYEDLHCTVEHEHPELGHNVWQQTYENLKGAHWLLTHRRPGHPRLVRFKTPRTRWGDDAWVHVRELASSDGWGEVTARIDEHNAISATTRGVRALDLDRDSARIDDAAPVSVAVDGDRLTFQAGEPLELHSEAGPDGGRASWHPGPIAHNGPYKHGTVTGPIHDVFHEPILFVWGASDPRQATANAEVARAWARRCRGARVDYPVVSDLDFVASGERLDNEHALFLVGGARSNRVVRDLESAFPIRVEGASVVVGGSHIDANDGGADRSQLGAMFIRPNPRRADRYVVVVEGVGPLGVWRSLSLPDMLPDFVVYDGDVTPARAGLILGAGSLRAGGFFGADWSLPP